MRKPLLVDIRRNSLDDGPGIRTILFFKGCPLACVWCQNPETVALEPEISVDADKCVGCQHCVAVCPEGACHPGTAALIDREACRVCGECVAGCEGGARRWVGETHEIDELLALLRRDRVLFANSGGGVTFSGGEPTLQMPALGTLAAACRREGIHTCLETCGLYDREKFDALVAPHIDLIYYDLKLFDDDAHRRYCRAGNERIKRNFEALLGAAGPEILPRLPLIPGVTTDENNLRSWARYLAEHGVRRIALLPYNPLWRPKARALGKRPAYDHGQWLDDATRERVRAAFADFSFDDF